MKHKKLIILILAFTVLVTILIINYIPNFRAYRDFRDNIEFDFRLTAAYKTIDTYRNRLYNDLNDDEMNYQRIIIPKRVMFLIYKGVVEMDIMNYPDKVDAYTMCLSNSDTRLTVSMNGITKTIEGPDNIYMNIERAVTEHQKGILYIYDLVFAYLETTRAYKNLPPDNMPLL